MNCCKKTLKDKYIKRKSFYNNLIILIMTFIIAFPMFIGEILHFFPHHQFPEVSTVAGYLMNTYYTFVGATVIQFIFGYKFYLYMYKEIFVWKSIGMNTLVGISTIISYGWSLGLFIYEWASFGDIHTSGYRYFFDMGGTIILFMLLGHFISGYMEERAARDINSINKLLVSDSFKYNIKNKTKILVQTNNIKKNDYIYVAKNERISVDGVVYKNKTYINESLLTGEVDLIIKNKGSKVFAGTINVGNDFIMKATVDGNRTILNGILNRIEEIQNSKSRTQEIADKISKWFVPVVLTIGVLAFIIHFFFGYELQMLFNLPWDNEVPFTKFNSPSFNWQTNFASSLYYSIAVIVIACPCALGIATPLAIIVGIGRASKLGIIYNKHDVFDKIKKIDVIAFDKTGTLTNGKLSVIDILATKKEMEIMRILESKSTHPLAKSIDQYLSKIIKSQSAYKILNIKEEIGVGISGIYNNEKYLISSINYAIKNKFKISKKVNIFLKKLNLDKNTYNIVCLSRNKTVISIIILQDKLNENSKKIIKLLNLKGIDSVMITGDSLSNANKIANEIGISKVFAEVNPLDKGNIINDLKKQYEFVGYVGDGINDLVALKNADFSISISLTNEAANAISDISIIDGDILNVYNALEITSLTRKNIIFNFAWAFSYNLVSVPLAFLGIIPAILAAIFMAFSEISIIINTMVMKLIADKKHKKFKSQKSDSFLELKD